MSDYSADKTEKFNRNVLMYMHAGSGNHGCEAIVRSLCGAIDGQKTVLTHRIDDDLHYGVDSICRLLPAIDAEAKIIPHIWFYILKKAFGKGESRMAYRYKKANPLSDYNWAISIGGDNYCYEDALYDLGCANSMFHSKGIPTALIGCSIEPELLNQPEIVRDMSNYSVISARESITYNALKESLHSDTRIELIPDSAFAMEPQKCELPTGFIEGKTIGINVSPMILNYECKENPGVTLSNYRMLIEHILDNTDNAIALIPHVVLPLSDDRIPLKKLYDEFKDTGRIILVEDHGARELKYIISQCRLLIAARTHATIAAYSTCVPTLVIGYSVKSRGIAIDLFGTEEGYVVPVQSLNKDNNLVQAFMWLEQNAEKQAQMLERIMPEYIQRISRLNEILDEK